MKRTITLIVLIGGLAFAGTAQAAPIRECGNYDYFHHRWTYRVVYGYTPVANLTTRKVRCSDARPFSLAVMRHAPRYGSHKGVLLNHTYCKFRWFNGEDWDVRCTGNFDHSVVHWQGGA